MQSGWSVVRLLVLFVMASVWGACGPAVPAVPAQGGPPWIELTTPHVTLWTDAPASVAREIVADAEHLRQVLLGTAFRSVAREGRIVMIALRDSDEFHAYASDHVGGYMQPAQGNALRQPLIVLPADIPFGGSVRTTAHEMTHVLSYALIAQQPRWFAEGLATYFETIRLDADAGTVELGREPTTDRGEPLRMHALVSLRTLFSCMDSCANPGFYVTAWALFNYLENTHAAQLGQFEQRLAGNQEWQSAWAAAFPDLTMRDLESNLVVWLTSGSHSLLRFNVKLMDYTVDDRTLGEADIHAIRALLVPTPEGALAEVEAARRIEATHVVANLLWASHGHALERDAAQAIAAAHPDDWRAWSLLAITLHSGSEAFAARDKACRLAAGNPAILPPDGLCDEAQIRPPRAGS